jgi:cephalosporin hydroxylase
MMFSTYLKKNLNVLSKNKQDDIENILSQPRYILYNDRPITSHVHVDNLLMSQGVKDCMTWRGIALGKSVYDFALIPMMIWEIQPASIIEIGSGEGASAIWMADLCKSYNLPTRVYSIDIEPPSIKYLDVTFLKGDSREISNFDTEMLPHPWIILEDAHIEVNKVMEYFEKHMHSGDYMIIEDTRGKKGSALRVPSTLLVDSYYCDYFGRNATSSMNTILCKREMRKNIF